MHSGDPFDPAMLDQLRSAALEAAYDAVLIMTADFDPPGPRIVYVNPSFTRMTGYEPAEIVGQSPQILQGPKECHQILQHLEERQDAGAPFVEETVNYRKDGSAYYVQWRIDKLIDATGTITHWVAVQREVTKERQLTLDLQASNRQLRILSWRDSLTQIANRRCFEEALQAACEDNHSRQKPVSLLMIDVDEFKAYNDALGHVAGDAALVSLAETLQANVHWPTDLVARYGGEEFAVLLPGTDRYGAMTVANRLRCAVEEKAIAHPESPHRVVTISIGAATASAPIENRGLVELADKALYEAKSLGRNCVVSAAVD